MPDGIALPITSANAPRYRYYTVNIVTNKVIGEIPFEDVSYERSVKAPGPFEGKITVSEQTNNLDLYNATLPGKTALYVVRDETPVWGGIIWGRTYDLVGRSLAVSASEFTSYLSHRIVWKTYSHSFTAKLTKTTENGYVKVSVQNKTLKEALAVTDASGNPTTVSVNFADNALRKYNKNYNVVGLASSPAAPADPGRTAFYVDMPLLPAKKGIYDGVGVSMKADTYDYLRDILTSTFADFTDIQFPNEVIEPGIREAYTVKTKQLVASNSTVGVATLTTETDHGLTLGQSVEISNVDPQLDGLYAVSEIPNKQTFKYNIVNPVAAYNRSTKIYLDDTGLTSPVNVYDQRDTIARRKVSTYISQYITRISRVNGVTTLTFDGVHKFEKGQKIVLSIEASPYVYFMISVTTTKNKVKTTKKVKTNTFDYKQWNHTVLVTSATDETITYDEPKYKAAKYNKTFDVVTLNKNSAKSAEPVSTLQLYPSNSSGYNIGDNVYIDGVDQPEWPYGVYDGYQKIYDVSPGTAIKISSYQSLLSNSNEDETENTVVVRYTCDADPKISEQDEFVVSGITAYPQLNGTFIAAKPSYKDGTKWVVEVKKPIAIIGSTAQASGAALRKNGDSWIAYTPNTSELRYSLKSEPNNVAAVVKMSYAKKTKTVKVITKERHSFKVGDNVRIEYAKSKNNVDQKTYGGNIVITGVSDSDTFTYVLIKGRHKLAAPTTDVAVVTKTATVTLISSKTAITPALDIPILAIRGEPTSDDYSTITVYADDHDLKSGDFVSINYNSAAYNSISTKEEPVQVTTAGDKYFRYQVGGPTFGADDATVYNLYYMSSSNVRVKVSKSTAQTARTATITSVDFSNVSNNQIIFTTSAAHNIAAGRKVSITGFPLPSTSVRTTTNTAVTITNMSYINEDNSLTVRFSAPHGLNAVDDIGAKLKISGAPDTAPYLTDTDYLGGLPLKSWLNSTTGHYIADVVSPTEVSIPLMEFDRNWELFGSSLSGVSAYLVTETKTITSATDYSKLNFVADVVSVPAANKLVFKYPGVDDDGFSGTYTPGVTVTATAPAYRNETDNQPAVGDLFALSGFRDTSTDLYSYLNKDGYTINAIDAVPSQSANTYVYLTPPKVSGKYVKYANVAFTAGKYPTLSRGFDVSGSVYLNQSVRDATEDRNSYTISEVTRAADNVTTTLYTTNHSLGVGDYVVVDMFKNSFDAFTQNYKALKITATTANSITYVMSTKTSIEYISWNAKIATVYFAGGSDARHNFVVGDTVTIANISDAGFSGTGKVITAVSPTSISFSNTSPTAKIKKKTTSSNATATRTASVAVTNSPTDGIITKVPTIYKRPVVYSKTYGEYPSNAGIGGITFSTMDYSNKGMANSPIFGSDLQTVAEILDKYSNGLNGFDYRIDPGLYTDTDGVKKFTRKFVLIPIYPPTLTSYLATLPGGKLARGQVATPAALGADKVIFEYPGNVTNVSMAEKAETSATRIFVRSGDGKAGSGTEVAYSAAADSDLLADNWPLLDKKETVTWPLQASGTDAGTTPTNTDQWGNHDDETDYHTSALRFLSESKPPAGDFVINVNGSVTPVIGSYNPGDWCSIIINDNFVKTRLNSVLEPRKDVIVRKIDAIKVSVPNNPAFPEQISLTLIPDWQVDAVGK